MELKIFFDQIDEEVFQDINDVHSIYNAISIHHGSLPEWENADFAIIGLSENRGSTKNGGAEKGANEIRKELYRLKRGKGHYKVVDMGNLRCGPKLDESYLRLKEVCEVLLSYNIIPLLIGGTHDMDIGQYLAYEKAEKLVNFLCVDSMLDMEGSLEIGMSHHHIHKILVHEPNYLFNFSCIGFQSYLCEPESIEVLEKLNFEGIRLGEVHKNIQETEPTIRTADILSFDIGAIRIQDAPGSPYASPFGLTGEEACQICWYAGLSEKLTSVGFYEYNPELDNRNITAKTVSTMIWYLMEGFYNRMDSLDFDSNNYMKFIVNMPQEPHTIIFYKSKRSEKWWMEVPYPEDRMELSKVSITPCSYTDYELALNGELSQRWILTHSKLI